MPFLPSILTLEPVRYPEGHRLLVAFASVGAAVSAKVPSLAMRRMSFIMASSSDITALVVRYQALVFGIAHT